MKKSLINKLMACALVFGTVLSLGGASAHAEEVKNQWKNVKVGNEFYWNYYDENGNEVKDKTITINGEDYKFDSNGNYIPSEEQKKKVAEQRAKNDAEIADYEAKYPETKQCSEAYKKSDNRWASINGKWHFNSKWSAMSRDDEDTWDQINGYWYHFDKDGAMERNVTIKDDFGNDCVLNEDGVLTNRKDPELKDMVILDDSGKLIDHRQK